MEGVKIFKEKNENPTIRLVMTKPKEVFHKLESTNRIIKKDPAHKFTVESMNFNSCLGVDFPGYGWYETDEVLARIRNKGRRIEITLWRKEGVPYVEKSIVKLLHQAKWVFIYV